MNPQLSKRTYWRSLEHLAGSEEISALEAHEFAAYDPDEMLKMPEVTRRRFMKLMGASMALAGLTLSGCRRWPETKLVPYTSNPKNRMPGVQEQYATIMELDGVAQPLLVSSYDGRPIKVEGNPSHPYAATVPGKIGSADAFAQASIWEMYDPDRSRGVTTGTKDSRQASDWESFSKAMGGVLAGFEGTQGEGLAILSETTPSPSAVRLKKKVLARYPKCQWYEYQPISRDNEIVGTRAVFGKAARPIYHLDKATTIVSLDADLLGIHPVHTKYASDWAAGRRSADQGQMSRLIVAESTVSLTGAVADVRFATRSAKMWMFLSGMARAFGVECRRADLARLIPEEDFVSLCLAELKKNPGTSVVAVGSHLPPSLHAVAAQLNLKLGSVGTAVTYCEEPDGDRPTHLDSIAALKKQAAASKVKALVILGGNPVYDAPVDLAFSGVLEQIPTTVHLSLYENETSKACTWHVPRAHYLEAWGDGRSWDGTISACQPLIEPLFGGKTREQILAFVAGDGDVDSDVIVRETFSSLLNTADFDSAFRRVLHDGLLSGSEYAVLGAVNPSDAAIPALPNDMGKGLREIRFVADLSVYDGRFAGNGWLQELPDPLTKVVWDNAVVISLDEANRSNVTTGDMVRISLDDDATKMELPVYVLPGQSVECVTVLLGYGRTNAGNIGSGVGFNTYSIRTSTEPYTAQNANLEKLGRTYELATTQNQHLIDEIGAEMRDDQVGPLRKSGEIIKEATFEQYKDDPQLFSRNENGGLSLQLFDPPVPTEGNPNQGAFDDPHRWGMAIDLSTCIGCHACVIACQAENNVPIVGKDHVLKNRQMHWIRIDRYFKGPVDNPEVVFQPLTCQQCENAPCEQVCPVGATMHDTEGINVMVYNRCVGTRYCSNNCPYKVRRFNYLDWHSQDPRHDKYPPPYLGIPDQQQLEQVEKIRAMSFNPEVTVRMRGVMEKCTYCIQRIHNTQIVKRNAGEEIVDGDIVTACQEACPTQAIVFGDLKDASSKVSQLHKNNRAYSLLDELSTRPRARYLAKISNPVSTVAQA